MSVKAAGEVMLVAGADLEAEADEFDRNLRPLLVPAHRLALGMLLRAPKPRTPSRRRAFGPGGTEGDAPQGLRSARGSSPSW